MKGMPKTPAEKTRIVFRFVGQDLERLNRARDRIFEAARRAERASAGGCRSSLMERARFLYSLDRVLAAHRVVILADNLPPKNDPYFEGDGLVAATRDRNLAIVQFLNLIPNEVL